MMSQPNIAYQLGIPATQVRVAAELYDEAFGKKFALAIRNHDKRISLLEASLMPNFAICALADNELVGLAGFQAEDNSLTSGMGMRSLFSHLGFFSGLWAVCAFSLYERKPVRGELLMDGIAVDSKMRGRGVGGKLLDEIISYAQKHNYAYVRLDVIDINEGAKRLYARKGFKEIRTEKFPYLKWLLGFGGSTTMRLSVLNAT